MRREGKILRLLKERRRREAMKKVENLIKNKNKAGRANNSILRSRERNDPERTGESLK